MKHRNNNSSEKINETFYLPDTLNNRSPGTQIGKYGTTIFPVAKDGPLNYESPVKKISSVNAAFKPFFNHYIRQTAARLSDIELALDCCDVSNLQFSTHALKDLFFDVGIPALYQLAVQMEESARKYQFQELKELLWSIKKIIGRGVKYKKQLKD
jgi:HPt (histidine-containing phosphotransfer) domain-containing protein